MGHMGKQSVPVKPLRRAGLSQFSSLSMAGSTAHKDRSLAVFDRILVPLDGSPSAEVALKVAEQIPGRRIQVFGVEPDCTDLSELCTGARDREAYLETVATALRDQGRRVTTLVALPGKGRA